MSDSYPPTIEDIMEDMKVNSVEEFRETILGRCKQLYRSASKEGRIKKFNTPYNFICCESSKFYRVLVDLGYGNVALGVYDDRNGEVFFLMFTDKIPKQFIPIAAAHEASEYSQMQEGVDQETAHMNAQNLELKTAERLGLKEDYLMFLQMNYPGKFESVKTETLI